MEVPIAAEKIFSIGPIPITNTMITTWVVTLVLLALAYVSTRKMQLVPRGMQNLSEAAVEVLQDLVSSLSGNKTAVFLPIVASFFFFILLGNYFGLLPGVGSIGFYQIENGHKVFVPLLRSMNSDLNTTLALSIVSLLMTHYLAVRYLGFSGYLGKFLSLNPIFLFVGIIEFVGEFTKVASLSFRLFGNIYAGETVLATASTKLFAFLVPIPFYFLEIIVGFVQALIFAILTLVFMVILTEKHGH